MFKHSMFGWAAVLVFAAGASAQAPTVQSLDARLKRLESTVNTLDTNVRSLTERMAELQKVSQGLLDQIGELQKTADDIAGLKDRVYKQEVITGQIALQGADGGYAPNLLGKMIESETFREEFGRAVQGKLVINNYTGVEQTLYINGTPWTVPPASSYLWVPFGAVTTHLAPWEPPKHWETNRWKFNGSAHELAIGIQ